MGTIVFSLISVFVIVAALFIKKSLIDAAYQEGRRAGLKEAIELAHDRSEVATPLAPGGELRFGIARAQVAAQIELELRDRLRLGR